MDFLKNMVLTDEMNMVNMNILEMLYAKLGDEWSGEACRVSYTRIYLIEKGYGEIQLNGKIIPLLPGNIYLIPAETEFQYSCETFLYKLYFHVNILLPDHRDLFAECNECIVLQSHKEEIDYMIWLWKHADMISAITLKTQLYKIVSEAISYTDIGFRQMERYSQLVTNAIQYIDEHLKSTLNATDIAEGVSTSAGTLQKYFRREVGVSLGRYVSEQVMFQAENMLRTGDETIREISERLEFCDQFYFSRCFVKQYGISPTEYRKKCYAIRGGISVSPSYMSESGKEA